MSVYVPETVPLDVCSPELSEYLFREFLRIGDAAEVAGRITLPELNIAPERPQQGDIFYADGVNWNPGGGEGIYGRVGTSWIKLSEGIGSGPSFDRIRLTAADDAGLASTLHAFQIGASSGANIAADGNEIMARNNGAAAQLFLNNDGGIVSAGVGGFSTTGPITTNGQVVFPAAQNASANANTLDDYEEAPWTPRIDGSTAAGVGTYSTQLGTYTKIGRLVFFEGTVNWTAHTGTGNILVEGLPFTSAASVACVLEYSLLTYTSPPQGLVQASTTRILIRQAASNAGVTSIAMEAAANLRVSGCYIV